MKITLSGGDFGGSKVDWIDDGTGHMLVKDHYYRLHEETASGHYVGKTKPAPETIEKAKPLEAPKKGSWFK